MDEFQSNMMVLDEDEENLIFAAKNIVKAFEFKKNLTSEARKILEDLGTRLSKIALSSDEDKDPPCEIEELLNKVQEIIMKWEVHQSVIWDCGPDDAQEYLNAVDRARKLIEKLESSNLREGCEEKELLQKAHDLLQTGMVRLEEEFRHLIVQNRQPFKPEHMSFRSSEDDSVDNSSIDSFRDDSVEDVVIQQDCIARASDEYVIPLVNPGVIPHLRSIANLMFDSNYGHECSQAYISVRKDALVDCLDILEIEKYSIEDVMKMEWKTLNNEIRKWIWAIKVFVRVYLVSEKWLSDQVFKAHESVGTHCFLESSKASILQLLNFGEAISVGPHKSEKLIRILDMYEVLADLGTDINLIYSNNEGGSSFIRIEFQDILKRLGDCAKATYFVFKSDVATPLPLNPYPRGGVHPLTRYVMNYLKTLAGYTKTLDLLLQDHDLNYPVSCSPEDQKPASSPLSLHFHSLLSILEKNLSDKSNLYKDKALRHLFLMNNIHYISDKVKSCTELRNLLGDDWIRKRIGKFQRHSMDYERVSWFSILALLKDDGLYNSGSSSISRTLLKEKLQSFYNAFEEVYRKHTGWIIPDNKLREDMRISTSLKVIQAYRPFVGRHNIHISDRHIKYSADELEIFLLDLFEGTQKSLHGSHRRGN